MVFGAGHWLVGGCRPFRRSTDVPDTQESVALQTFVRS